MKRRAPILIAATVCLLLAVSAFVLIRSAPWRRGSQEERAIIASGFIEAEEIGVAPEVGGRILSVEAAEGDLVGARTVLVRLDDALAQAQVKMAQADLEVAQATLDQVRAGARPEALRSAQAQLAQAEAARGGAYQAWQDALALLADPQELEAQIALAEAQLAQAEAALRQAGALRDAAQIAADRLNDAYEEHPAGERNRVFVASGPLSTLAPLLPADVVQFLTGKGPGTYAYEDWEFIVTASDITVYRWVTVDYPLQAMLLPNAYWRSWIGVNTAQAAYDGARQALQALYRMRDNPQQAAAQADAAEAEYHAAEAAVALARAQLEGLEAGATAEEIAAAEAQVQQARARLESAQVTLDKMTLVAPTGGWVLELAGQAGELAAPGIPIITLADLDQVRLTVYVPENRLGHVQVGQRVEVRVDSFPDRVFTGRIVTIASEAEFTPRNVQTEEERVNMVFAVEVLIPNPDHALKPGMPADARILTSTAGGEP